jgi:hypothetical protein
VEGDTVASRSRLNTHTSSPPNILLLSWYSLRLSHSFSIPKADTSQKAKADSAQQKTGPTSSGKSHVVPASSKRVVAPLGPGKTPGDAAQEAEFEKLMVERTETSPGTQRRIQLYTSDQIKKIVSEDFVRWALRRDGCRGDRLKERPLPKEGGIKEAVAETYMAEILQTHWKVFLILAVISVTAAGWTKRLERK